jgi:hypothetical protein
MGPDGHSGWKDTRPELSPRPAIATPAPDPSSSPSEARMSVAMRSRKKLSCVTQITTPGNASSACSSSRSVGRSRSLVGS